MIANKHITVLLVLFFIYLSNNLKANDFFTIAVSEFKTQGAGTDMNWIGETCADAIVETLSKSKNVRIIERQYLSQIIEEIKLQMSGIVDDNTAVEVGNLIGANYFIFGSASVMEDNLIIATRIVNIETAQAVSINRVTGKLNELFQLQDKLIVNILNDLALSDKIALDESPLYTSKVSSMSDFKKIEKIAKGIPIFSLDPARNRKQADYNRGIDLCDNVLSESPNSYLAMYYKGLFYMQLEDWEAASESIENAKQVNASNAQLLLLKAMFYFLQNDNEKAKSLLKFLALKYPDNAAIWYALAKTHSKDFEDYQAIEALINSLSADIIIPQAVTNLQAIIRQINAPKNEEFSDSKYYNLTVLLHDLWNNNTISSHHQNKINACKTNFPDLYLIYYIAGYSAFEMKNYSSAISEYKTCIKLQPTFDKAHRELAYSYFKVGRCDLGEKHSNLYLKTSNATGDYQQLMNAKQNCN